MGVNRRARRAAKKIEGIKPVTIGEGKNKATFIPSQKNENAQQIAQKNALRLMDAVQEKENILRRLWLESKGVRRSVKNLEKFERKVWSLERMKEQNLAVAIDLFYGETLAFTIKVKRDELIGLVFRVESEEKTDSIFWKKQNIYLNSSKK